MPSGLAAVPPAQLPTKYRDVIKIALRPRQTRAFVLAAVAWHLFLTSALFSTLSLSLISPLTLAASLLSFGLGILPLLAKRKRNLSQITSPPARLPSSKAQQLLAALSDPNLVPLVCQHVAAFVVLALGYAALLTYRNGGWAPQIWVESHASFYLNERFLYLVGQSIVLGAVYAFVSRSLPSPQSVASPSFDASTWTSDTPATIKHRVVAAFSARLPRAAIAAALTSTASILVYSIVRIRMWSTTLLVLGTRGVMRRLFVPSFRVEFACFEVSVRSVLFSIAATCAIETAYLLLDVYLTHPLPAVSKYAKFPNRLLLDGIEEPVLFFSKHAFSELARLSAGDKEMRGLIYRDVGGEATAWMQIRDRCLGLLEESKLFVVRRGQVPTKPQASVPTTPQSVSQQQQQKVVAKPPQTIWDQLAAGQTTPKDATTPSTSSPTTAPPPSATVSSPPQQQPAPLLSIYTLSKTSLNLITLVWKLLPSDAKHVLFGARRQQTLLGESPSSLVSSVIARDAHRTICAALTLQNLLCKSLTEDPYGTVSKDIKRILAALVGLDSEIRTLGMQLESQAREIDEKLERVEGSGKGEVQEELKQVWTASGAGQLDLCLVASMREILNTFERFDLVLGDELEVRLGECLR